MATGVHALLATHTVLFPSFKATMMALVVAPWAHVPSFLNHAPGCIFIHSYSYSSLPLLLCLKWPCWTLVAQDCIRRQWHQQPPPAAEPLPRWSHPHQPRWRAEPPGATLRPCIHTNHGAHPRRPQLWWQSRRSLRARESTVQLVT